MIKLIEPEIRIKNYKFHLKNITILYQKFPIISILLLVPYYKYWFEKFQKFSIKHTVWSQRPEVVLFDFITVFYFLM